MMKISSKKKVPVFAKQVLISIILSLSPTLIYAEVTAKGLKTDNTVNAAAVKKTVVSAQPGMTPDKTDAVWQLHAEQWELARSGETILSLPVLKQVIKAWLSDKQKMIEIQYPGGEDGEFWVQELTDWLVSLGIPSKTIVTTPGSGADDVIKFNIVK
ncbi:MAG: hypothetical protein IMF15_01835 [Proteobacteria bacterium]|nr:hypothetical protein [Pseudomonadota bacterium]